MKNEKGNKKKSMNMMEMYKYGRQDKTKRGVKEVWDTWPRNFKGGGNAWKEKERKEGKKYVIQQLAPTVGW